MPVINGIQPGIEGLYEIHRRIRELGCDIIIQDTTALVPRFPSRMDPCLRLTRSRDGITGHGTMVETPAIKTYTIRYGDTLEGGPGNEEAGLNHPWKCLTSEIREVRNLIKKVCWTSLMWNLCLTVPWQDRRCRST
jgi:hypothetical protein